MKARAALLALLASGAARADPFPARVGTSGLLDVADAQVLDFGAAALGLELRLDRAPGAPQQLGPSPLTMGFGLGHGLEVGISLREGGLPGDPRPSPLLFGAALKLQLFEPGRWRPGAALQLTLDKLNWKAQGALDAVASAELGESVRVAALAGFGERLGAGLAPLGPRAGAALALRHRSGAELVLQALAGPDGALLGGALRWSLASQSGVSLGAQWQPGDRGLRISLGIALSSAGPRRRIVAPVEEAQVVEKPAEQKPGVRIFRDPLPRLRLKVKAARMPGEDGNRHLQYGPPPVEAAPPAAAPPTAAPPGPR